MEYIIYKNTYALKSISDECGKKVKKVYDKETWGYYCTYKEKWFDYKLCKNCKFNKANGRNL